MEYLRAEHVRLRMSLAVQLVDGFTDRAVASSVVVRIDNAPAPIRKPDGYYVFLNAEGPEATLRILSQQYEEHVETVCLSSLDPLEPVVKIRLQPNRHYPFPRGTTCVEGKAAPGGRILIWCPEMTGYLRLMEDYKKEEQEIRLFHPAQSDLEGKSFRITETAGEKGEIFTIRKLSDAGEERYLLDGALQNPYGKMTARIYPVLALKADETGRFFAPLPFLEREHAKTRFWLPEQKKEVEKDLIFGSMNPVDLDG